VRETALQTARWEKKEKVFQPVGKTALEKKATIQPVEDPCWSRENV